jgi:peptide/nickel transport system substrate-binding protein
VLDSAAAYATYQTHAAVVESLLRPSPDGAGVEAGLAESWEHDPDAATWTFTLREDARFSDGSSVTADDVVFSVGIWQDGPNFGPLFANILGVTAVDERTVMFELGTAFDNTFLAAISGSYAGVMPADFAGMSEDDYYQNPIGAGAYQVEEWTLGGRIVLVANEHFYGYPDRPGFERVVIDVVTDENARAIQFGSGEADIVEYLPIPFASQYEADSLQVLPIHFTTHLSLNVRRPPFDDPAVRQAVAHAIDYQAIVDGTAAGFGEVPIGLLSPNIANWAPPSVPYYTTDLDEAAALIAESSAADGAAVELIYDSGEAADALAAQVIQSNLAQIGITVELTGLETGALLDRAFAVDSDMMVWGYGAVSPDISDPLGWFLATEWLFTGHEMDTLLGQLFAYAEAEEEAGRLAVITEVQDQAIESAHAIAAAQSSVIHVVSPALEGFASPPWGVYFYDTIAPAG